MKPIKNLLRWSLCFCLGALTSCIADDMDVQTCDANLVKLDLQIGGTPVVTKATMPGTADWNENLVATADVFFFDADNGARVHYQRIEGQSIQTSGEVALSLRKDEVQTGTYDIYVIANYTGASLTDVQTVEQLKECTMTTAFKFPTQANGYEDSFLMDGKKENVSGSALVGDIPVGIDLARAAAKIRVKINYGTAQDGTVYAPATTEGAPKKRMMNYATVSTLLTEAEALTTAEERGLQSMASYQDVTDNEAVFYSYANEWSFNPESSQVDLYNESYILLNLPVMVTKPGEDPVTRYPNYYRVSLNNGTGVQSLERNHFYDISVTVAANGSGEETVPVDLEGKLQVQDWKGVDINVGNENAEFLEVNEEHIRINNANEDNSLMFYSSSIVTSIVVSDVKYVDKFGVERPITEAGRDYPQGSIYYPTVNWNRSEVEGAVTINSVELINVPKTFTLTITNNDGLSKTVYVEQYPLEYITSTQGWYSWRDYYTGRWSTNQGSTYEIYREGGYTSGNSFDSRVVTSYNMDTGASELEEYYYNNNGSRYTDEGNSGALDNAHIYHVHITAASDEYKLGYPKITNGRTDPGADNADVVSPSFMIASQLGANTGYDNVSDAASQCEHYGEATGVVWSGSQRNPTADYSNVKYYDDWRLPTQAELEIIVRFQGTDNSAIDEVLAGKYYWAANGLQTFDHGARNDAQAVRCVRDVKPEEETTY